MIEEHEIKVVKIHKLETLYNKIKNYIVFPIDITLLEKLDKLYIDARYPSELGLLPDGKPTRVDTNNFYQLADNVYTYIKRVLESEK